MDEKSDGKHCEPKMRRCSTCANLKGNGDDCPRGYEACAYHGYHDWQPNPTREELERQLMNCRKASESLLCKHARANKRIATLTAERDEARAKSRVPGHCDTCKYASPSSGASLTCRLHGPVHPAYFCYDYYPAKSIAAADEDEPDGLAEALGDTLRCTDCGHEQPFHGLGCEECDHSIWLERPQVPTRIEKLPDISRIKRLTWDAEGGPFEAHVDNVVKEHYTRGKFTWSLWDGRELVGDGYVNSVEDGIDAAERLAEDPHPEEDR